MYGGPLENIQQVYLYARVTYWGLFIWKYAGGWAVWLWSHTIDDSSAQGGDKENCSVGKDNWNMCKDVAIET